MCLYVSVYFALEKPIVFIREEPKPDFKKQLIQFCPGPNKLIQLNLKSAYTRPIPYFPKLFLTKVIPFFLWFDLIILDDVLVNFSSDVHRFSFTTNHTHSY